MDIFVLILNAYSEALYTVVSVKRLVIWEASATPDSLHHDVIITFWFWLQVHLIHHVVASIYTFHLKYVKHKLTLTSTHLHTIITRQIGWV